MIPKIDAHGNLMYTQTGLEFISGEPSLLQTLTNRLRLLRGESNYHPTDGMDFQDLMLYNDISLIKREISSELRKDLRVLYTDITHRRSQGGQLYLDIKVKAHHG